MLPTKFGPAVSEKIFFKSANQDQELPEAVMFYNGLRQNVHLYRGTSIDASYYVSVHLAKGFQWRRLKCEKLMED
jgi:hypothetical protein